MPAERRERDRIPGSIHRRAGRGSTASMIARLTPSRSPPSRNARRSPCGRTPPWPR
jgi:hypothetical protein